MVLIPDVMLKEGEGLFLDDTTLDEVEKALRTRVVVVEATPRGIYGAILQMSGLKHV
jgi:NifB/MoaA-like Fe-S oxidoreductase